MDKFVGTAGMCLVALLLGAPSAMATPKGLAKHVDLAQGKKVYARHCAGCHGPNGRGDGYQLLGPDPANLTRAATTRKSDAVLLATIHEGKPNMPSWKTRLSKEDSQAVLAYIRTLRK